MAAAENRPYLITATRVWDGVSPGPIDSGFVVVEGASITAVGRTAQLGSMDAVAIDLPGATLLPGLVNAHVHLTFSGSARPPDDYLADAAAGPAALTRRAFDNLRSAVDVGVTTVRDLGTTNEVAFAVRGAVADGTVVGPRVLTSGSPITVTGGHGHWFGHACDSASEVRAAARRQVDDGADVVKIMASGGNLTPGSDPFTPQFSARELGACVTEAQRSGVMVAAHAYGPDAIRLSVEAGASTIEHCLFETRDGVAYDPAVGELMAARDVAFVPTLTGVMPQMLTPPGGDHPRMPARFSAKREAFRDVFRRLIAAGAPLVAGSDAGVPHRGFSMFPHDVAALADEAAVGLRPRQALVAATSGAAGYLGIPDTGVLAPGHRADLLAVDGNPLAEIADLARTRFVMASGRIARHDRLADHARRSPTR